MDPIWLKRYPPEVPQSVDPSVYPTLLDLLDSALKKHAAQPAYLMMGKRMSCRGRYRLARAGGVSAGLGV